MAPGDSPGEPSTDRESKGPDTVANTQASAASTLGLGRDDAVTVQATSRPVEMSDLASPSSPASESPGSSAVAQSTRELWGPSAASAAPVAGPSTSADPSPPAITPVAENPTTPAEPATPAGLHLTITLLIPSTDSRHKYVVDGRYMQKRNVSVADNDPVNMSVYTLKELIWRDWRDDWEPRPTNPSSIRIIHMGRLLDDKTFLKDNRFSIGDTPHVVHMTVKPQDAIDDEDGRMSKGGRSARDGSERTPGCRCTIL